MSTELDFTPVYERLFGRARAYNREHPEPTLYLDRYGYEYSVMDSVITCSACGRRVESQRDVTCRVRVSYNDESAALGRRDQPLGMACDDICAGRLYERWLHASA